MILSRDLSLSHQTSQDSDCSNFLLFPWKSKSFLTYQMEMISILIFFVRWTPDPLLRACYTWPVTPWRSAERWRTLTIAGPSLYYRRVRSAIVADRRWTLRVLNRLKTFNTHQRVRGDARLALGDRYTIAPHDRERYSIVVHVRGALLSRCTR